MDNDYKIYPKPGLKLRKIGSKHMIVETVDGCVNLANVYSMNNTAAWLWDAIAGHGGRTPEELAEDLCRNFNADYGQVSADVIRQLDEWLDMDLITIAEN